MADPLARGSWDSPGAAARRIEGSFRGEDGLELFYQAWRPPSVPAALVVIVHGLGEHGGRYGRLLDALLSRGIAAYALDHRGHGRSPGQRGHLNAWAEYRQDLAAFLAHAAREELEAPLFLFGHSLGALIALEFVEESAPKAKGQAELRGLVLSGTPLQPVGVAGPWLVLLARVLSRLLPRTPLSPGLDPAALSRDPAVVRAYEEDPLVHRRATARWGTETLAAIQRTRAGLDRVRLPLLVVHGGADRLNSADGSREIFERAGSPDKSLRIYEGAYHEPHNDIGWERAVEDVASWIESRV